MIFLFQFLFVSFLVIYYAETFEEKRNIGSMKNWQRNNRMKRDTNYDDFPDESEIESQIYQNVPLNYNDLSYVGNELYPNYGMPEISNEKRFLGKSIQITSIR